MDKFTLLFILIALSAWRQKEANAKLFYVEKKYPLLGKEEPPGSPWPKPLAMNSSSSSLVYLSRKQFAITSNLREECDIIDENKKFYMNVLFPPFIYRELGTNEHDAINLLSELRIDFDANAECPGYPTSHMDEYYELKVQTDHAVISARSVWGALRGLETFSQLTFFTSDNKLALNDSTWIVDEPRFRYRGLLIDTARHFIPISSLMKQIDVMAYNKFNVFHWHITDDQSFPFESLKYPNLTERGRYSRVHVYKQEDMRKLVDHARFRGIRVIPEFDTPGHTDSFGKAFPNFITVCWKDGKPYQAIYGVQADKEILNPTVDELYPVLKGIIAEFKLIFPDEYIHLGMDEVYYECWKSNPNISEWMRKMNFSDYNQLEAYYSERLLKIAKELNKKVTVWQDVFDNGVKLAKTAQIQIWKDTNTLPEHRKWYEYLNEAVADGHKVILSSPWYINFVSYGFQEWFKWYQIEPFANFTGTEEQKKLVIGGEAALWSEYVDGSNLETRLWPRASVIAERLWSPAHVNCPEDAKFRLDEHRCRMLRRGIPAAPVLNGYCGDYEYGMKKSVIFEPEFNYEAPYSQEHSSSSSNSEQLKKIK